MTEQKILFVEYCADDFLGGTVNLDPLVELAYRRIIDMIYSTNDELEDNDSLQYSTKTGTKWKKIRQELIDKKKLYVENNYLRNKKCSEKLAKSQKNIDQKAAAGKASAEARKALKDIETDSTAVAADVITVEPTNQRPKDPSIELSKEDNSRRVRATVPKPDDVSHETFEDFIRQRKTKFTNTALKGIRREAEKAGCSLEDALRTATERGWQSFKSDWIKGKHETNRTNQSVSERADAAVAEGLAASRARRAGNHDSGGSTAELRHLPDLRKNAGTA